MHTPATLAFWQRFLAHSGRDAQTRCVTVFHFCDNDADARELAALTLAGVKRGTASLLWGQQADGEPTIEPGDLHVITDFAGQPLAVIETTQIDCVPFNEVSADFAACEGEGDGTLAWWREAHWAFFGRECARIGREPSQDMPVLCERFSLVYHEMADASALADAPFLP